MPATNPSHAPAVWAIDGDHQAAYWFPRDCPRVTVWCSDGDPDRFGAEFQTTATRLHGIEQRWAATVAETTLYRYELPAGEFRPWPEADGQWITEAVVEPERTERLDDLVDLHRRAGIELRAMPTLWPLRDQVVAGSWPFSIIRMQNASPRIG